MVDVRPNRRVRKTVDYEAFYKSDSENSDDDFKNCTKTTGRPSKPSKFNKLKLAPTAEKNIEKETKNFTKLKLKEKQDLSKAKEEIQEVDLTIAEPDLVIHSICSQETNIISSCECPSSEDLTDSSDLASPEVSTLKLYNLDENVAVGSDLDDIPRSIRNTGKKRTAKRRIVDDDDSSSDTKKTKLEAETLKQETLVLHASPKIGPIKPKPPLVSPCRVLLKKLAQESPEDVFASPARKPQDKKALKTKTKIENPEPPAKEPRLLQRLDIAEEKVIQETSIEAFALPVEAVTPAKRERAKPQKEEPVKVTPKEVRKLPLVKPTPPEDVKEPPKPANVFPKVTIITKAPVWNPPGKSKEVGSPSALVGSPATGLRLGLSRNRRTKPLHPDVKIKN